MKRKPFAFAIAIMLTGCISSRYSYVSETKPLAQKHIPVVVASANERYNDVSKINRFLLGDHFRKEWATPVSWEVLDLDSMDMALTPTRLGGGNQTKTLRLEREDGREYVLRSINKDPSKVLPSEFSGTIAGAVAQDQISSSNPFAALAVAELAEAAGIFHTTPKLVYVAEASRLGPYNELFAGTLCLFEERPRGNQEDNPAFGYSKNVVNTATLVEKIKHSNRHRVDAESFLYARIFDMWIGDWDRHEDQWVWASFKEGDMTIYKPIPRDRDQAFAKLDGLLPTMASRKSAVRRTQNFDYTIRDINGLNMSGNPLDRFFLSELSADDWVYVAKKLQLALSDEKIEAAFRALPPEIAAISMDDIISKLKRRRDDLLTYSAEYCSFLDDEVNIIGSNKKERFVVTRMNDHETAVSVYAINRNGDVTDTLFDRTFITKETTEVRLYGLGGADQFQLNGKVRHSIVVRIIGGSKRDRIEDNSKVRGWKDKTVVYDAKAEVHSLRGETAHEQSPDSLQATLIMRSYRYDRLAPKIAPGFNPDDGLFLGGGLSLKKYKFGTYPYGSIQSIWGNYALATGAYNFQYEALIRNAIGKWDLNMTTVVNAPKAVYNFYGFGNETEVAVDDWDYYRIRMNQIGNHMQLSRTFKENHTFRWGIKGASYRPEKTEDRFISTNEAGLDSLAFDRKYFASITTGYQFSTLGKALYPRNGLKVDIGVEYAQNLEVSASFAKINSTVSYYYSVSKVTFALRAGGTTILGNGYEFYQAATLGGEDNLRGYRRTRFSGKSSFYQNTEVRYAVDRINSYLINGQYGVFAFFDSGRVWQPGESSAKWHNGYGAGTWLLLYERLALSATYGMSSENKIVTLKAGFTF